MKNFKTYIFAAVLASLAGHVSAQGTQWTKDKANQWYAEYDWLCGMNYIPANAINYTAMWDKTSFSPDVMDRELALAKETGLNCARVVLQYAVFEDNQKHFMKAFDKFLSIADKHGIKVMPIFFDDCVFGVNADPIAGVQPEVLEGWYAWAWSPSPGHTMVIDERLHGKLENYVKTVMAKHRDDDRILLWDLYNEPTNAGLGHRSLPLLRKVFQWAREIDPVQPISAGIWNGDETLNQILADNSDVITYHVYADANHTSHVVKDLEKYGRPTICTEWMNRVAGSTILDCLPVFYDNNSGCMMWGLVNGKTQTHLPWGHKPEMLPYTGPWQHDIYHTDMTPYNQAEIDLLKRYTSK